PPGGRPRHPGGRGDGGRAQPRPADGVLRPGVPVSHRVTGDGWAGWSPDPGPAEPVRREAIRRFAAAIGSSSAVHRELARARALGHPDLVAPPTFPVVFVMPANEALCREPGLGLDWTRVLHRGQAFRAFRPLWAGDRVSVRLRVEAVLRRGRNTLLVT